MRSVDQDGGWRSRRFLSAAIRTAVTLVPVAASLAVGLVANRILPAATTVPGAVTRSAGILLASLPVLVVVDVVARRFLPLAALLQLSLVFPDQTPSRFRLALKAGSGRHMARAVSEARSNGLSDLPDEGAEQLVVLATAIGDHDRRTRGHSERVRLYAELIGEALELPADERNKLQWAALIHDIGKVTVPPEILNKKGKPDADEWAILQEHPAAGEQLVGAVENWLGEWVHAVGGHHEKWDGSGYPRGLAGTEIPRAAAIVAVADSFEVMTAVRSYKKAMTLADARREMTRCAGSHFSPEVVRAFLNLSIGDLRRSMGLLATIAHVPVLGRFTTAASYAPDTVSTAVSMTSSAATAGAGAVAVTASMAVGTTSMAAADAPPAPAPMVAAPIADAATAPPLEVDLVAEERNDAYQAADVAPVPEVTAATVAPAPASEPDETTSATTTPSRRSATRPRSARTTADTIVINRVVPAPAAARDDAPSAPVEVIATEDTVEADTPEPAAPRAAAPASPPPASGGNGNGNGRDSDSSGSGRGRSEAPSSPEPARGNGGSSGSANAGGNGNGNGGSGGSADAAPSSSSGPGNSNGNGNGNAGGNGNGDSGGGAPAAPGNGNAGGGGNGGGNGNGAESSGRGGGRGK